VSTPTLQQARSHYDRQRRITAGALAAVRGCSSARRPLLEVASDGRPLPDGLGCRFGADGGRVRGRYEPSDGPWSVRGGLVAGIPHHRADRRHNRPFRAGTARAPAGQLVGRRREVHGLGRAADRLGDPGRRAHRLAGGDGDPPGVAELRADAQPALVCAVRDPRRPHLPRPRRLRPPPRLRLRDGPGAGLAGAHDRASSPRPTRICSTAKGQITGLSQADAQAIRDGADITTGRQRRTGHLQPPRQHSHRRPVRPPREGHDLRHDAARGSGARRTRPASCGFGPSRSTSSPRTATTRSGCSSSTATSPEFRVPVARLATPRTSPRRAMSEAAPEQQAENTEAEQAPEAEPRDVLPRVRRGTPQGEREVPHQGQREQRRAKQAEQARLAAMSESERAVAEAEARGRTGRGHRVRQAARAYRVRRLAGRATPRHVRRRVRGPLDYLDLPRRQRRAGRKAIKAASSGLVPAADAGPAGFDGGARGTPRQTTSTKFCAGPQAGRNRSTSWHGWPRCTSHR
jgi:hypothetical protein